MKRMFMVFFVSAIGITTVKAQANCDALKKENAELKKMLSMNEPVVEAKSGDLTFAITKVEGNTKAQTLAIEVLIKNNGKNLESFGSEVRSVLDANGNEYRLSKAYAGAEEASGFMSTKLFRDAPIKCKYIFQGIEPEVKMIKLFNYPVKYHVPGTNSFDFVNESIEFRDFPITWK